MYTLRIINEATAARTQIYLGTNYTVKQAVSQADGEAGIKCRVFGDSPEIPKDGLAIQNKTAAFIMLPTGSTLEALNRPEWHDNEVITE